MGREGSICKMNRQISKLKTAKKEEIKSKVDEDGEGNGEKMVVEAREKSEWETATEGGAAKKKAEMRCLFVVQ